MSRRLAISQPITVPQHRLIVEDPVTSGLSYNRSTGGSWTRLTGKIVPLTNLLLMDADTFIWDVRNTGTYTLRFVTALDSTTPVITITTSQVVNSAGAITFIPDANVLPIILEGGKNYYLQIVRSGAAGYWDYNGYNVFNNKLFIGTVYYDGSPYNYAIPARIKGRPLNPDCIGIKKI